MITECAALIKTHDYRPQRILEYQATVISSQRGASSAFSACSSSLSSVDYKPLLFDVVYLSCIIIIFKCHGILNFGTA